MVVDGSAQTTWGIDSDQQDFAFVYRRQTPIGVFHAMNLGISIASGRYLYFLNAGDVFASHDTLESVRIDLLNIVKNERKQQTNNMPPTSTVWEDTPFTT